MNFATLWNSIWILWMFLGGLTIAIACKSSKLDAGIEGGTFRTSRKWRVFRAFLYWATLGVVLSFGNWRTSWFSSMVLGTLTLFFAFVTMWLLFPGFLTKHDPATSKRGKFSELAWKDVKFGGGTILRWARRATFLAIVLFVGFMAIFGINAPSSEDNTVTGAPRVEVRTSDAGTPASSSSTAPANIGGSTSSPTPSPTPKPSSSAKEDCGAPKLSASDYETNFNVADGKIKVCAGGEWVSWDGANLGVGPAKVTVNAWAEEDGVVYSRVSYKGHKDVLVKTGEYNLTS